MKIQFCKKCIISNQKPVSVPELKHNASQKKTTIHFNEDGICDACRYAEWKETHIDWNQRENELIGLLDRYRRNDGYYDVLVPGSGGKDSCFTAHILKYKYGMNPLTVTWPPHIYTDIGWKNFKNWLDHGGFDNISYASNGRVHRLLTKLATKNLFHPFQPFIIGQKNIAPKLAIKFNIKLIFYGENEAEYGNPIQDNLSSKRDHKYYSLAENSLETIYLGGVSAKQLIETGDVTLNDLEAYLPPPIKTIEDAGMDVRYLGYYLKWTPQESYYYAVQHMGFEANPERSEGTFSKYRSLDDKIDGFHYWTLYLKCGLGRASYEAAQEIRNHHLTREEGVALVHRFDGEFPKKYFGEFLEYVNMSEQEFFDLADRFRSPHLWEKIDGKWELLHRVS